MRRFLAALSILSIVPLGGFVPNENELRRSADFFPLAGVLFGALFYGIGLGFEVLSVPPLAAAMLLALLPEALTKGFHLDGLADTADGFLSGRLRERKLEIMRDSHIGTMGVAAIFALLGMKFALFASLRPEFWAPGAAVMMLAGRVGITGHLCTARYARSEGLGRLPFEAHPRGAWLTGLCFLGGAGYLFFGIWGVSLAFAGLLFPVLWSMVTRRVIGGGTGDTVGCCEELSELLALAVVTASIH